MKSYKFQAGDRVTYRNIPHLFGIVVDRALCKGMYLLAIHWDHNPSSSVWYADTELILIESAIDKLHEIL